MTITGWELVEKVFGEDTIFSLHEIEDLDDVEDWNEEIEYNEGWYNYCQTTFRYNGKMYGFEYRTHTSDNVCDTEVFDDTFQELQEMVTITKAEYERLLDREHFLNCLQGAGVDNWGGYSDAYEIYESEEE